MVALPADDRDLDDAALWAVIDSAAATAASYSSPTTTSRFRKPLTLTHPNFRSPPSKSPHCFNSLDDFRRPQKIQRSSSPCISELVVHPSPQLAVKELSPYIKENFSPISIAEKKENFTHCLSGRFPTVSLFKDYQDAAMAVSRFQLCLHSFFRHRVVSFILVLINPR
ncbi:hypothetical protein RND81_01G080000 [Saponaria officinalis]|uniref:Uncharacterized protein n=1 Tax=Saponaria officinalis TaxID=3572 RepID=A0AAW1NDV1_SAPOF